MKPSSFDIQLLSIKYNENETNMTVETHKIDNLNTSVVFY